MEFEQTKSMTYYCCPACNAMSTDRAEIEKYFLEHHPIRAKKFIRCNICGYGWDAQALGEEEARIRAEQCCQSHIDDGKADREACISYFYSHGRFGYVKSVKGGCEEK